MSAINVGELIGGWKSSGMKMGAGLGARAVGRAGMLGRAFQSGGMKGAWGATEGRVLRGMGYGAAIGAGLNAGMSLIDQANTGNYSIGRTAGAALKGGALGALGGAAFGVGDVFLGGVRGVKGAAAPSARAARRGIGGIVGSGRLGVPQGLRYSGTGFATQTPTFAAAARGMGRGMRAAGSVARDVGPRMMANARRVDVIRGSGLMKNRALGSAVAGLRGRARPAPFTRTRGGSNLTRNFSMNANNYDNVGVHLHQINPGTISPVGTSRVALGRPTSVNGGGMVGMMPNRQPEVTGLMYPSSMFHRNPSAMRYLE